jgi:hypothetical protein
MNDGDKKQLVAVILAIVAGALIGYGTGSWCVGIGCYLGIMNARS